MFTVVYYLILRFAIPQNSKQKYFVSKAVSQINFDVQTATVFGHNGNVTVKMIAGTTVMSHQTVLVHENMNLLELLVDYN